MVSPISPFTLRQLQFFVAVAEQSTVSRAAQSLSISQSSVTEAVKELQSDLGVALFERHPRGLNTSVGTTALGVRVFSVMMAHQA